MYIWINRPFVCKFNIASRQLFKSIRSHPVSTSRNKSKMATDSFAQMRERIDWRRVPGLPGATRPELCNQRRRPVAPVAYFEPCRRSLPPPLSPATRSDQPSGKRLFPLAQKRAQIELACDDARRGPTPSAILILIFTSQ